VKHPRGGFTVRTTGPFGTQPIPRQGQTLSAAPPPWWCRSNRHLHSASLSGAVDTFGCSSSDVVVFLPRGTFGCRLRVGTDRAFGHGRESAGASAFFGRPLLRETGAARRCPSGRAARLPPGTASAMSNQVASGTSPREHRANVCGNTHVSQRTLRVLKPLRSGDPQKRSPWKHGRRRNGEQRREGNDAR